jgi:putative phage-type endonuclease
MKRKSETQQDIRKKKQYKLNKMENTDTTYCKNILKELLDKPLIKQRTTEWFNLRKDRLTASDLHDAIKNPHSLVKRKMKGTTFNSSGIPALKWGTMFETMAIRIYSHIKKTKIHEFGLIINEEIENFGASPDGITDEGKMIEIKCPYSRKIIDGNIPEKYYYQIQGQLAVCKLYKCDYIECEFIIYEKEEEYIESNIENDNYLHGIIAEKKINGEFVYIYSNENQSCNENIKEMNKYIKENYKLNYWKLEIINIQEVDFDKEKWNNVIIDKIKTYNSIYFKEKKYQDSINLFIDEDKD